MSSSFHLTIYHRLPSTLQIKNFGTILISFLIDNSKNYLRYYPTFLSSEEKRSFNYSNYFLIFVFLNKKRLMITNFADQSSIISQYISELRNINIQNDRLRFRENLERISMLMAYEVSKTLDYQATQVETPLGEASVNTLKSELVIASILRAGIPLHNGFLKVFDKAENAFISAYRKHHRDGTFDIKMEYVTCPDLTNKTLIIVDPMLATGASLAATLENLKEYGVPKIVHIVTIIASEQGIDYIRRLFPDIHIWTGAIDEELTAKSYIVPGLGDAGDLAFGCKLQE
jgi:uracil phosphoribosyltransferase